MTEPIPHVTEGVPGVGWYTPPEPVKPPTPCPRLGPLIESGAGCGCGPKHLCTLLTRVVSARDCAGCADRESAS